MQDFWYKYKVGYTFRIIGIHFLKIRIKSGILFRRVGKERVCFEALIARPRPKSGQVHPSGKF